MPTSRRVQNMQLLQNELQIQIMPIASWLMFYVARINILFIIKANAFFLIQWLYKETIELLMVNEIWVCGPISLKHMSFCIHFGIHT